MFHHFVSVPCFAGWIRSNVQYSVLEIHYQISLDVFFKEWHLLNVKEVNNMSKQCKYASTMRHENLREKNFARKKTTDINGQSLLYQKGL
jgi:hypothetical protein